MPLYEYAHDCGERLEVVLPVSEHSTTRPCACGGVMRQVITAPHVMQDIEPYRSVVTGELIGGRHQHREHLKRHNLVEIGNEPVKERKRVPLPPLAPDIKRTIAELKTHGVPEEIRERR